MPKPVPVPVPVRFYVGPIDEIVSRLACGRDVTAARGDAVELCHDSDAEPLDACPTNWAETAPDSTKQEG